MSSSPDDFKSSCSSKSRSQKTQEDDNLSKTTGDKGDKRVDKAGEKAVHKVIEKTVGTTVGHTVGKTLGKTVEKTVEKTNEKAVEKAVEKQASPKQSTSTGAEFFDEDERLPLSRLICEGISNSDLERLKANGLCTIEAVAFSSTRQLCKIHGISEKKAQRMIRYAKQLVPTGFSTATALHEKKANVISITTGSSNLDTLLQGGFETGSLIEIFGENNAGKTQICMTLAVTCQLLVESGGAEGKCIYIDTEGVFSSERLLPIATRFGLDKATVLDNVVTARAFNTEHLFELLTYAAAMMSEQRYALLIIDSATALFRAEFVGRGELFERQSLLGQFLRRLRGIADEYGVAVVYTNQVVADVGCVSLFATNPIKAVGGHIMGHASTTRLLIRKARGPKRVCKVFSSATIPESEVEFSITQGGLTNPED